MLAGLALPFLTQLFSAATDVALKSAQEVQQKKRAELMRMLVNVVALFTLILLTYFWQAIYEGFLGLRLGLAVLLGAAGITAYFIYGSRVHLVLAVPHLLLGKYFSCGACIHLHSIRHDSIHHTSSSPSCLALLRVVPTGLAR
jgi:hypothetical protein